MKKNVNSKKGRQVKKSEQAIVIDFSDGRVKNIIFLCVLIILVVIAYSPAFFNGFTTWDDDLQVTDNADITSLSFHNIKTFFSSFYVGMYQPMTTFCFAVIYKMFGLNAVGFHSFSLLLHLINIILVYKLMEKISDKKEIIWGLTLLFSVNPLQTEAVAWVSATSTLLYTMFFLLSLNFYIKHTRTENSNKNYFTSLLLFLMALFSKSAAVTLPLIMLLYDYFYRKKMFTKDLLNKIPFFALSLLFGIITIIGRAGSHNMDVSEYYSFFDRILFLIYSLMFYIISAFVPFSLSAFHPYPGKSGVWLPAVYYIMPIALGVIVILLIKVKKHKREILFGALFFLLCISVMAEFVPFMKVPIVKERYNYLPCIGLYFSFFTFLFTYTEKRMKWKKFFKHAILILAAIFLFLSFARMQTWKNDLTLWNNVIKKYPDLYFAYYNRGTFYFYQGNYKKAVPDYLEAVKLNPDCTEAYTNLGVSYKEQGFLDEAIDFFTRAIKLKPDYQIYNNRGGAFGAKGLYAEAITDFNKAIELNPKQTNAYIFRGVTYGNMGLYDKAISDFSKAINYNQSCGEAYYNRSVAYYAMGRHDSACLDCKTAAKLGYADANNYLAEFCK